MNLFQALGVNPLITAALDNLGFTQPTDVQKESIPPLIQGQDVLAQAKTGTGKTAAFGLPILNKIDLTLAAPQALILAPTRELAIQVAEALQSYAVNLNHLRVLPIYGGQDYRTQLRGLKQGAHIIVGTPGRIIDHLDRQTLDLSQVNMIVLDEADEMLNMGFIDGVEKILKASQPNAQRALFSATLPPAIKKICSQYLNNPHQVSIKAHEKSLSQISQFFTVVYREHKFEALTRFLATEHGAATIIFARTKSDTVEISQKLESYDYRVAAINGDLNQAARQQVIAKLKSGSLEIVVATDVAARGLDIERLDYVINYDIPFDAESYVHRIGRTGRAGRTGKSLVLISPREVRTLKEFQRITGYNIQEIQPPTQEQVEAAAEQALCNELLETQATLNTYSLETLIKTLQKTLACDTATLSAILLSKLQSLRPQHRFSDIEFKEFKDVKEPKDGHANRRSLKNEPRRISSRPSRDYSQEREMGMTRCEMNFGREHGITPSDIVGLITNRCQINRKLIGRIDINRNFAQIDIAEDVAQSVIHQLANAKFKRRSLSLKTT